MSERNLKARIIKEEWRGYENAKIWLFRVCWDKTEETEVNWGELVQDYDQQAKSRQVDLRRSVMELLTWEEIEQLKKWFRAHTQSEVNAYRVEFPLPKNQESLVGKATIEGISDFIIYSEDRGYDLPFEVFGYYNLKDCKKINQGRS